MSQVIGFYADESIAQSVRDELFRSGFTQDQVKVFSRRSSDVSGTTGQADEPGFWESVKEFFGFADESDRHLYAEAATRGSVGVSVDARDDDEQQRATEILRRGNAVDLDQRASEWRQQGWQGRYAGASQAASTPTASTSTATSATTGGAEVLPVVEEQIQVGKRQVESGGVRIHTRVTETPVQEQVQLREEHVNVERRAVDRPVTAADENAFQERTVEMTETSERPVVSKEARVVEEVVVNKDVDQRTETVGGTVRRTDVDVQRTGQGEANTAGASSFNDPDTFATQLSRDERFRGRAWNDVETDARRDFEQRYPGSTWDQFKDAIHRGYEKVRQNV